MLPQQFRKPGIVSNHEDMLDPRQGLGHTVKLLGGGEIQPRHGRHGPKAQKLSRGMSPDRIRTQNEIWSNSEGPNLNPQPCRGRTATRGQRPNAVVWPRCGLRMSDVRATQV